ncbi:glycosyltransferase [Ruminococcaceae bacterium OttesenSCG-928-L11]|nr:glycosyltransferase [Ruminococcaceae bacterium OttesenSCG-928-L11]
MEISLCMIVKNEEGVLARCLDCADRFADEIVVVDTGSTDRTKEIARQYTDHVLDFQWCDDFSAARNYAFAQATKDYILWLDADDIVDDAAIDKLNALKHILPPEVDAVMMKYHTGFDEAGAVTMSYFRERMVRRDKNFRWQERVHEHIAISGNVLECDIAITHGHKERTAAHSTRNLNIYRQMEAENAPFSSRALFYFARELRTHGYRDEAETTYNRFLQRPDGWLEDRLRARNDLADLLLLDGRDQQALELLLTGFAEAIPRPEACCGIGRIFLKLERPKEAIFWYEQALTAPLPEGWGFTYDDYGGLIPHLQLCMLHYRMGDTARSLHHHREAKALKPRDPAVEFNETFFVENGLIAAEPISV